MSHNSEGNGRLATLTLGALGIVYGDIGTSPLYAFNECLSATKGLDPRLAVLGCLSLIFWSLTLVVSVKYIMYVMRADNRGEGGIFALLALAYAANERKRHGIFTAIVLAGAALLYGDGIITPAISVLSAAEGLKTVHESFSIWVVPISCIILLGLFVMQKHGTGRIGVIFGPIMLVWFTTLGLLGGWQIIQNPAVLEALNPWYGINLIFSSNVGLAATILGAVVLAVTGAEALYADMGHFGRKAITLGWFAITFPGLLLNYFGQGAYSLSHIGEGTNLFYAIAPSGPVQYYLIALAFLATVIASQALVSGAFSLTSQAIQLGFFPRLQVVHTSENQEGQIYVPAANRALAIGCIAIVIGFGSSDRLASAYGIAVTGTMAVTTYAFFFIAWERWKWALWKAISVCTLFMAIDLLFFSSNLHKIGDGGWLPLLIGAALLSVMHTWRAGRDHIFKLLSSSTLHPSVLIEEIRANNCFRSPGTAVFMSGRPSGTPVALLHHLKCNGCVHENVVLMSFITQDVPHVSKEERMIVSDLTLGFWQVVVYLGYMESPDALAVIHMLQEKGLPIKIPKTTFFFNREVVVKGGRSKMWGWQKSLYGLLSRNAFPARDHYNVPANQFVEMGLPVQI